MVIDALLTDGNYKHTYGALYHLVKQGLRVGVICETAFDLCNFSRLPTKKFIAGALTIEKLEEILSTHTVKALLPVSLASCGLAARHREQLDRLTGIKTGEYNTWLMLTDKAQTFAFLRQHDLPIPQSIAAATAEDALHAAGQIGFPVVLKHPLSGKPSVLYCNDNEEVRAGVRQMRESIPDGTSILVQEYVQGPGTGFFGLYDAGQCLAYFMHERVHEYPLSGGPSAMARSIHDARLKEVGHAVFSKAGWTGVGMVEAKRDVRDGDCKVMEVNAKFWGSLELALTAGVNFPYLLYLLATGQRAEIEQPDYQQDIYFRWLYPFDRLWYRHASDKERAKFDDFLRTNGDRVFCDKYNELPVMLHKRVYALYYARRHDYPYPHGRVRISQNGTPD